MDFAGTVQTHPDQAPLVDWHNSLVGSQTTHCGVLAGHIMAEAQFGVRGQADKDARLANFAKCLPSPPGPDPLDDARVAMNKAAEAGLACLTCAGPVAALPTPGEVQRVAAVVALISYNFRAELLPTQDPTVLAQGLTDDTVFQQYLDIDRPLRGYVPNLFWADAEDVRRLETGLGRTATMTELRTFLGIDSAAFSTPGVLMRIRNPQAVEQFVPTCFDACGHAPFRNADYFTGPAAGVSAPYGWTLDLATNGKGAKEVVTDPLPPDRVEFVRTVN
ncbi:MAG: hypothetical protein U0871_01175 [Gemmataceae bacterium]